MSRCWTCGSLNIIHNLEEIGGCLMCPECRSAWAGKAEVTVSEKKPVACVQIFPAEGDNYRIDGFFRIGGVKIEVDTDMNQVRDFFTKRKQRRLNKKASQLED